MSDAEDLDLPPRVPTDLVEMDRLVVLMGVIARGKRLRLRRTTCDELVSLCGTIPSRDEARRWKGPLRELREEMSLEPDPEAMVDLAVRTA